MKEVTVMKKIICLLLVFAAILSLCACGGVKLTDSQKEICDQTDEFFSSLADSVSADLKFSSKITKASGKIIYNATLNLNGTYSDENLELFSDTVLPMVEKQLAPEDVYIVLYLQEKGDDAYRIVGSNLDPDVLD